MGKGARVVLGSVAGLALCPVTVIRDWVALRPAGPGPLLIHKDGLALSRYQFVSVIKKCLGVGVIVLLGNGRARRCSLGTLFIPRGGG